MNKKFIREQLIKKHGTPNSEYHLNEYLDFVSTATFSENEYNEIHHILTRSQFPEFIHEKWNLVKLDYPDHIKAHELLFQSFNLRTYQRPLNYMKSWVGKDFEMVSNAAKKGWQTLKADKEKFDAFRQKRRDHMLSLGFEENSRRSHKYWDNISDEEYELRCKVAQDMWTDELREQRGILAKEYLASHPGEMTRRMNKRWDEISSEDKESFINKMSKINADPDKRKKAGKSIKEKWKDPLWHEKMLKRKHRGAGVTYQIIQKDGTVQEYELGLSRLCKQHNYDILLARSFCDEGSKVSISLNLKNKIKKGKLSEDRVSAITNTIGCIINKIK